MRQERNAQLRDNHSRNSSSACRVVGPSHLPLNIFFWISLIARGGRSRLGKYQYTQEVPCLNTHRGDIVGRSLLKAEDIYHSESNNHLRTFQPGSGMFMHIFSQKSKGGDDRKVDERRKSFSLCSSIANTDYRQTRSYDRTVKLRNDRATSHNSFVFHLRQTNKDNSYGRHKKYLDQQNHASKTLMIIW
jgi:hypothetical protein